MSISQDYPTIRPSLNLDFANSKALDGRITFTRNSIGTYVGANGLIQTVGINQPRFDHDPVTGESLGLLIEEQRINSQTNSQPQSGSFTGGDATVTYNTSIAPNGATEACRIARNGTNISKSFWSATRSINFNANTMVLSCWAKGQNGNDYFVWSFQNLGGAIVRAGFLLTGDGETQIITNGNGGHTLQIQKYPDGWYRCIIIGNTQSSGTTTQFLYTASAYGENDSTIGGSTLVWGFQLEAGSFPTSYIPTSGSSATRTQDNATVNVSSWYNNDEGTVLYESKSSPENNTNSWHWIIASGTANRIGTFHSSGSTTMYTAYTISNNTATFQPTATVPYNTKFKVGFAYNRLGTANQVSYLDGNLISQQNASVPSFAGATTTLTLGKYLDDANAAYPIDSTISKFTYYPKKLTNAQLQTLTQ
jgi:hypothetical protein